jgi:cyanophycinase-like exopeptidase
MTSLPRILTIMGSGETAPTMVKVHRELVGRLGSTSAVLLDTPYGFQENAPELASRAVEYFKTSVNVTITPAGLGRIDGADPVTLQHGLNSLTDANYVFAGPGSPTYALRQWKDTTIPDLLHTKIRTGGVVTFASAAALTLGSRTVPVYEIYKCGEEPYWLDGLNLLGDLGIPAVVIPHYNNAEGGHHDTRFCYLGERRLVALEAELDTPEYVLGVDEHTGLVIDFDAAAARVVGNGVVTLRVDGASRTFASGETIPLALLQDPRDGASAVTPPPAATAAAPTTTNAEGGAPDSLRGAAEARKAEFDAALAAHDSSAATRAVLDLEADIRQWSADTVTGTDGDFARDTFRGMILKLGEAASSGLADPRATVAPYVEAILEIRKVVRAEKRYDLSDIIRDALAGAKVEVRDTPAGVEWVLQVP